MQLMARFHNVVPKRRQEHVNTLFNSFCLHPRNFEHFFPWQMKCWLTDFLDCILKTSTVFLMTIFRERFFSLWLNTLLWSSTTRLSIHGGVMLLAGGSLSPPRSWFPSGCCTVWASPLVHYARWAEVTEKLCFYLSTYPFLLNPLFFFFRGSPFCVLLLKTFLWPNRRKKLLN